METWRYLSYEAVDRRSINLIENIYKNASMYIKTNNNKNISINKSVRQDIISTKPFIAVLDDIFREMELVRKRNNGSYLNHFRFANDVIIFSNDSHKLGGMIH